LAFFVDRRWKRRMKRQRLDLSGGFVKVLYGGKTETTWITSEEEKTFSLSTLSFFSLSIHYREGEAMTEREREREREEEEEEEENYIAATAKA
jgi:hypothetical protein